MRTKSFDKSSENYNIITYIQYTYKIADNVPILLLERATWQIQFCVRYIIIHSFNILRVKYFYIYRDIKMFNRFIII